MFIVTSVWFPLCAVKGITHLSFLAICRMFKFCVRTLGHDSNDILILLSQLVLYDAVNRNKVSIR
jgi:hypothetical protein